MKDEEKGKRWDGQGNESEETGKDAQGEEKKRDNIRWDEMGKKEEKRDKAKMGKGKQKRKHSMGSKRRTR